MIIQYIPSTGGVLKCASHSGEGESRDSVSGDRTGGERNGAKYYC